MKKFKFIIHMEYFSNISGGTRALAMLCHRLNSLGYESYVTYPVNYSNYITPFFDKKIQEDFIQNNDDYFVIYPEQIAGNPFNAKNVIRWILYTTHESRSASTSYADTDYIFKYSNLFKINPKYKTDGLLQITDIRDSLYNFGDLKTEREGSCFILKKGYGKKIIHDTSNSICIDGKSLEEKIAIFNKVKTFYSYDSCCYYNIIALICGCESIIIPDEGVSKEEFLTGFPFYFYGIAYGLEDREWAKETKHLMAHNMMVWEEGIPLQIEKMMQIIQTPRL